MRAQHWISPYSQLFRHFSLLGSLVAACFVASAFAQSPAYERRQSENPLQDRIGYLLTLLETDRPAAAALGKIPALSAVKQRLVDTRSQVFADCKTTSVCRVDPMMLTDREIDTVGDGLAELAHPSGPLSPIVREQMRRSGVFQRFAELDDAAMIRAAWHEIADGINRLYRVYGQEQSYKTANDGPSYSANDADAADRLRSALASEIDGAEGEIFFAPWSRLGFDLLIVYQRTEAIRHEPLSGSENRSAFARARGIDWRRWRYTAIVLPGSGLNGGEVGLSATGAFEIRMAIRRWRQGLAPFILVSGGHVHPNRTPYAEAIEMKRELITHYSVPEEAIVIDPHARHTTTNLRNAVRLLFRMGVPVDKPFLVTAPWIEYVASQDFAQRCLEELGYEPARLHRESQFDLSATPNLLSLHVDPRDPLDP